ncbi:hypothetical protein JQ580_00145 [Bradyrhizobium japonicum]|uniref:hypothetical protein n=1 Tax=Bradyrhizobium japonicum TaxID=375 RepID=UPI001BA4EAC0|nr:hypothetical protein [Bradyrhizobium japonicum]MBR0989125.1 hypothetical protein [Bradyrhizobium japonicum]
MAQGSVIVWQRAARVGRFFGYICDDSFGKRCPRELSVAFDERDLVGCVPSEIVPQLPVSFAYHAEKPEHGRNPRARLVQPKPLLEKSGEIVTIMSAAISDHYGFIRDDDSSVDFYFIDRVISALGAPLEVGARCKFWVDADGKSDRARRVEVIEQ